MTCGMDVVIGGGEVLPEVNFTLPSIPVDHDTIGQVLEEYRSMAFTVLERPARLGLEALVLEFEHLFELTLNSKWGADVTAVIKEQLVDSPSEALAQVGSSRHRGGPTGPGPAPVDVTCPGFMYQFLC